MTSVIHIKKPKVIIDIGAAIGDFSIFAAKKYPNTVIYAYEPFNKSFNLLKKNIGINNLENITPLKKAVTSKSGYVSFLTTSQAVQNTTIINESSTLSTTKVKSINLDDMFNKNKIKKCDLLKIDCEGGEFDILFGAKKNTLSKIKNIAIEYHDGFTKFSHQDLVKFLKKNNFIVKIFPNKIHGYLGIIKAYKK